MAVITGNTGNVAITGNFSAAVINVVEWSGNIDNEFFDSRVFGTATDGVQEYRGSYQMTGAITGYLDGTAVPTLSHFAIGASATSTITLTASTGRTYVFSGHIHNWNPSAHRFRGLNTYTCNFRSHGDLTSIN